MSPAVRPGPLQIARGELPGARQALGHLLLHVALSILAALGVVAEGLRNVEARFELLPRQVQEVQELLVEGHHAEIGIDDTDALIHVLERRLEDRDIVAPRG